MVDEYCKLQFSIHIAKLVTVPNFLKICIILWLAYGVEESPLIIMGDAMARFLQRSDLAIKIYLASRKVSYRDDYLR